MQPPRNPGEKPTRIVAAEYVRPRHDLCSACHQEKSTDRARTDGLWRHGPTGNCLGCHHPHASGEPALLRRPAGEICLSCHGEGLIHTSELHAGLSDCISCHNAHLGSNPMLLKADHVESF